MRARRLVSSFAAVSLALGCAGAAAQEKPEDRPPVRDPLAQGRELEDELRELANRMDALRAERETLRERAHLLREQTRSMVDVQRRQFETLQALRQQLSQEREMLSKKPERTQSEEQRLAELAQRVDATAAEVSAARTALEVRQRDMRGFDATLGDGRTEDQDRRSRQIANELDRLELRRRELTGDLPHPGMQHDPRRPGDAPHPDGRRPLAFHRRDPAVH
jgi:DNA repair exonuclease SbcCD ATPase subunit